MVRGLRVVHHQRHRGLPSKALAIEQWLADYAKEHPGGPTSFALIASAELQTPVSKQEINRAMRRLNLSRKKFSKVPLYSVPDEREAYLSQLLQLWTAADQMVFIDEKKRALQYAYAPVGERPSVRRPDRRVATLPPKLCVIGALGIVEPRPMASGEQGNVGLFALHMQEKNFQAEQIAEWFEQELSPLLHAYPGPRSIVLIDNMPEHRREDIFPRIRTAIQARGAILITNPPQSPDLNPIEKLWDVSLAAMQRLMTELAIGKDGHPPRSLHTGDLINILQTVRLSEESYHFILHTLTEPDNEVE